MASSIFKNFFNETVSVYSVTTNGYGDLTRTIVYSSIPCRWIENAKQSYSDKRRSLQSTVDVSYSIECWISADVTIQETYEFYKDSVYHKILKILPEKDVFGTLDHYLIYLA